jgi:hypothetical protein
MKEKGTMARRETRTAPIGFAASRFLLFEFRPVPANQSRRQSGKNLCGNELRAGQGQSNEVKAMFASALLLMGYAGRRNFDNYPAISWISREIPGGVYTGGWVKK